MEKENHAEQNACGWMDTIRELVAALECDYERLEELRDEADGLLEELQDAREAYAAATSDERMDGELGDAEQRAAKAVAAFDAEHGEELAELMAAATVEGDLQTEAEHVRQRIQEGPLSVQVRSGWTDHGGQMEAEEFEILLSTGGPALRIMGELDEHRQPCRAWLEYQDWGTPWTHYYTGESSTLLTYCQQFYFGE